MAMEFIGAANGAISIGDFPETDFDPQADEFTLMGWFTLPPGQNGNMIAKRFQASSNAQYALGVSACQVFARVGGILNSTPSINVDDNQRHHAALRYFDNGGNLSTQLYVDGVQDGSTVIHDAGFRQTAFLVLGARNDTSTTTFGFNWTGFLEDLQLYNLALTPREINIIANSFGHAPIFNGLVGRYMLNEQEPATTASAGSIKDTSKSGRNGSPNSSPMYREALTQLKR